MNDQHDPNTLYPRKSRSDTTTTRSPKQVSYYKKTCDIRTTLAQLSREIDTETLVQYKRFCKDMITDFTEELVVIDARVQEQQEDELEKLRIENLRMKEKLSKLNALLSE